MWWIIIIWFIYWRLSICLWLAVQCLIVVFVMNSFYDIHSTFRVSMSCCTLGSIPAAVDTRSSHWNNSALFYNCSVELNILQCWGWRCWVEFWPPFTRQASSFTLYITNALCFINPSQDIKGVKELSYHSQLSRKIRIT